MYKVKRLISFILVFAVIFSVSYVSTPTVSAAKIKLNKTSIKIKVKQTYKLKIKGTKKKAKWSSSKKKVATVSSKGVVKGKSVGSATITAKIGKKKYKCKVKVKASGKEDPVVTGDNPTTGQFPGSTTASTPTSTTSSSGTTAADATTKADASTEDVTTEKLADKFYEEYVPPVFSGEEFENMIPGEEDLSDESKNVVTTQESTLKHIVIKVENKNEQWLESATVYYKYVDDDGSIITYGTEYLGSMKPGETQYVSIEIDENELEHVNFDKSIVVIDTVPAYAEDYEYVDQGEKQDVVAGEVDETDPFLVNFTIKNHSGDDVEGSYIIYIKDKDGVLIDTITGEYFAEAKDAMDDAFVYPTAFIHPVTGERVEVTDPQSYFHYEVEVIAHSAVEITEEKTLGKDVVIEEKMKLASCVLVKVTNKGERDLSDVELEAVFYDASDNYVTEDSATLTVLQAKKDSLKTQYMVIPLGDAELQNVDLDNSVFNISASDNSSGADAEYTYADTNKVIGSIETVETNEYQLTLSSTSTMDTTGSFIVLFKDAGGNIVDAYQDVFELDGTPNESDPSLDYFYFQGPTKEVGGELQNDYASCVLYGVYANIINQKE